jgi:mercuric ion transport protein
MNSSEGQRNAPAILNYVSLFTSFGTLLCCALPSVLVLLGLGATVASFLSAVPFLVTMSRHKVWVFAISGGLIALSFVNLYLVAPRLKMRAAVCPPGEESACEVASRMSRVILWIAATIYAVGFFVAFALGPILTRFE